MRKVKVYYKDNSFGGREQEWNTKEYFPDQAELVAENLELMGCYDIRFVPVREDIQEAA